MSENHRLTTFLPCLSAAAGEGSPDGGALARDRVGAGAKGHPIKVEIARQLRTQTPMSRRWIAERLKMGGVSYVSTLLSNVDSKLLPL